MTRPTNLERTLLAALLAGDHPALATLREQLAVVEVTSREFSGVGFFTHLAVPSSAPRLAIPRWVISDVNFRLDRLEHEAGALLFVEEGLLTMLEAYTYASENWPTSETGNSVTYVTRGKAIGTGYEIVPTTARDMVWLAEEFAAAQLRAPEQPNGR